MNRKIKYKWPFSIAMLNYQRVRSQSCELRVFTSQYIVSPRCFQYRRKAPNFFEHGCYGGWLTSGCSSAVLGHDRSCWSLMQRRKWSSITGATWHWNRTTIGQSLLVARRSNHFTGPQILVLYRFFFSAPGSWVTMARPAGSETPITWFDN